MSDLPHNPPPLPEPREPDASTPDHADAEPVPRDAEVAPSADDPAATSQEGSATPEAVPVSDASPEEALESDEQPVEPGTLDEVVPNLDASAVNARIEDLAAQLADGITRVVKRIDRKDAVLASIHKELDESRERIDLRLLRPLFSSVTQVIRDIDADIERLTAADGTAAATTVDVLNGYKLQLLIALEDSGLRADAPRDAGERERFDPRVQSRRQLVATHDPELNGHVARVVAPGYYYEDELVINESVDLYRHQPNPEDAAQKGPSA